MREKPRRIDRLTHSARVCKVKHDTSRSKKCRALHLPRHTQYGIALTQGFFSYLLIAVHVQSRVCWQLGLGFRDFKLGIVKAV